MAEQNSTSPAAGLGFKDAVCIDTGRVYDSCCDRDCLEDLRVFFTPQCQSLIEQAVNLRAKSCEILDINIDVEPVTFNRGFYSVDMLAFFRVNFDVYTHISAPPQAVSGICVFDKKVILFGSEGNAKIFSSEYAPSEADDQYMMRSNLPKACVQAVDPIILSASMFDACHCGSVMAGIPSRISNMVGGELATDNMGRGVQITLGLFTIVQLVRNVQLLIPVYDFCMPEKECVATTDNPCELFKRIKFPTDEFFPPREIDCENNTGGLASDLG